MKRKKAIAEDPLSVGRHSGNRIWGYEVHDDGSITLAPCFADRLRAVIETETGLKEMQEGIAAYVARELAKTAKLRREWWDILQTDIGVPIENGSGWTFHSQVGRVFPPKEGEPE